MTHGLRNPYPLPGLRAWKPGGGRLFLLDAGSSLPPEATFTRSGPDASWLDQNGVVRYSSANVCRTGHYVNGVPTILLEPTRSNLILRSTDWSVAPWGNATGGGGSAPVCVANAATAPDGSATATRITFAAPVSGDQSIRAQTYTTVAASSYTQSVWVKAWAAGDVGKVLVTRGGAAAGFGTITLTANWQRVSRTEVAIGVSSTFELGLRPSFGGSSGTVDVLVWNGQAELGTSMTSDIPTAGSTVTRAAETLSLLFPPSPREMTVYVDSYQLSDGATGSSTVFTVGGSVPQLTLYGAGSGVYLLENTNPVARSSSVGGVTALSRAEFRAVLSQAGTVQLHRSVDGGAESSGAESAATALPAAWGNALTLSLTSGPAGAALQAVRRILVLSGTQSLAQLRNYRP